MIYIYTYSIYSNVTLQEFYTKVKLNINYELQVIAVRRKLSSPWIVHRIISIQPKGYIINYLI